MKSTFTGIGLFALAAMLAGCEDTTGPESGAGTEVEVAFAVASAATAAFSGTASALEGLVVSGSNGTLEIEDLRLIVSEFELEGEDDDDCDDLADNEGSDDDCEDFELPPFLVDVPLTGGVVEVAAAEVRPGAYKELEFETRGLDDDEDDDARDRARILELIAGLRQSYPSFPQRASMVARGTFTPTGGEPRPFVVYFDAEVEIELELEPPLVLPGEGQTQLVVDLRPDLWFRSGDQVRDLSQFDNRFVEFEFEMERGFDSIEIEFDD